MPVSRSYPMRKQPVSGRARHTVDCIIAAAEELLVNAPYEQFNTNAVATRAGVSVGSVYQYFASKEAIVALVRLRTAAALQTALLAALKDHAQHSPAAVIRALVATNVDVIAENAPLHAVLSTTICDVGVAPDFETRVALAATINGDPEGVPSALRRLSVDAFGEQDAWPIVLGAWGLMRVMTTLALMEGRFVASRDGLVDEITAAILTFVERRLDRPLGQVE